jgi:hypothetical protein
MSDLGRFSEPFQATGSLAAPGVVNQLGRPHMEAIEVLVREAIQNCWDARRDGVETVEVEIGARTLDDATIALLRDRVLPDTPPKLPLSPQLGDGLQLLHFADFGTAGLGGPTRADVEGKPRDFADFVRNIGQAPDKELGGGSYGYGKAAFYISSKASTIIVDTYCLKEKERRLIAYGLGEQFHEDGTLYTGRHWWGVLEGDVPEPLLGDAAATLAAELGLPERGPDDYGTTVAIVAPDLHAAALDEDLDLDSGMAFIAECLLWNFWPKMTAPAGERPAMSFRLSVEGEQRELEDPRRHPRIGPFAEAMDLLRDPSRATPGDPFSIRRELECHSPKKHVGTFALCQRATTAITSGGLMTSGAKATAGGVHHVALMRTGELVVTYWDGPVLPVPERGYAGVFRCTVELDPVFCASEPPTHDSWNPQSLPKPRERKYVNACFRRMDEIARGLVGTGSAGPGLGANVAVGRFADRLASLLGGLGGPGARQVPQPQPGTGAGGTGGGGGGGGGTVTGPQIVQVDEPELRIDSAGEIAIVAPFVLDTAGAAARLRARVEVLTTDGKVEKEPPIGAIVPVVLRWTGPGDATLNGAGVETSAGADGRWEVWVEHHPDLMVRIAIDAEAVNP